MLGLYSTIQRFFFVLFRRKSALFVFDRQMPYKLSYKWSGKSFQSLNSTEIHRWMNVCIHGKWSSKAVQTLHSQSAQLSTLLQALTPKQQNWYFNLELRQFRNVKMTFIKLSERKMKTLWMKRREITREKCNYWFNYCVLKLFLQICWYLPRKPNSPRSDLSLTYHENQIKSADNSIYSVWQGKILFTETKEITNLNWIKREK